MSSRRPSERAQLDRRVLELSTLYEVSKILGASLELEQNLTGILRVSNYHRQSRWLERCEPLKAVGKPTAT